MTSVSCPTLLLVDDDARFRDRLALALRDRGFDVSTAGTLGDARRQATADPPEHAIVDLRLPDGSGLEMVGFLHELDPSTRVVVLTGYGSIATAVDAIHLGAHNYVPKPADADMIVAAFERGQRPLSSTPDYDAPSLARAEWEHIHRVLTDCGGNISEAARRLGIHRRSLQRKLQKYPPNR